MKNKKIKRDNIKKILTRRLEKTHQCCQYQTIIKYIPRKYNLKVLSLVANNILVIFGKIMKKQRNSFWLQ